MNEFRGIDLGAMKKAENTIIGFEVKGGFINTEGGQLARAKGESATHVAVPCLEVTWQVANGERRRPFNVTLALVVPLIHALSEWAVQHTNTTIGEGEETGAPHV